MWGLSVGVESGEKGCAAVTLTNDEKARPTLDALSVCHKISDSRWRERSRGFYFSYRLWACYAREENDTNYFFSFFLIK